MHDDIRDPAARREVLIALGACFDLPRAVACRLAAELDAWQGSLWRSGPAAAARLGVPAEALAAAGELRRRAPEIARREEERARALGARIVTRDDAEFPGALHDLELPPPCLWVRGTPPPGPERAVAIVGSRRADPYGREAAELFARELAAAGLTVVSGFARGIDAAAHRGALAAERPPSKPAERSPSRPAERPGSRPGAGPAEGGGAGCATAAVLGSGLGVDYPRGHRRLGERIAQAGALLTEFPCGLEPKAWQFPVRNRLIAALAAGVLVVRAAPRSGSLITARLALDLGREVLAVPGRIFEERSAGTNALIADGAHPALRPRDVLEVLGLAAAPPGGRSGDDGPPGAAGGRGGAAAAEVLPPGLRGRVLALLVPGDPASPEAVAAALGEPVDRVLGALLELELEGRIRREPGPAFTRRAQDGA